MALDAVDLKLDAQNGSVEGEEQNAIEEQDPGGEGDPAADEDIAQAPEAALWGRRPPRIDASVGQPRVRGRRYPRSPESCRQGRKVRPLIL